MTDKILNDYYINHKDMYLSLTKNCTSIPEIILKLDIYGKTWMQWDWVLLFTTIIEFMFQCTMFPDDGKGNLLYDDILQSIDTTDYLDKVITNKDVILNFICLLNSNLRLITPQLRRSILAILAHAFKKFPSLWNMSWMYAKYKDCTSRQWKKYHRLRSSIHKVDIDDKYFMSRQYYDDFIDAYFKND